MDKIKLKFKYDNVEINISTSGKINISDIIKRSLSRKKYDLNRFIEMNDNFGLEKCRICKTHYPPLLIQYHLDDDMIIIDGFKPTKSKIYCYGLNKKCSGIKMNSNSVEFISKTLLLSNEDALNYIKSNNKSNFYRENWSDDNEYKRSQSRDKNYFKNRYGDNWNIEYNDFTNKISKSNSVERYISEYGDVKGREIFNKINKKKDSMSFNYFLKKNDNDYQKAKCEYDSKLKLVSNNLEAFINRYGVVEGELKYKDLNDIRRFNQLKYIKTLTTQERKDKYSVTVEKIGVDRYNKWRESTLVPITRASKESAKLFKKVIDNLSYEKNDIYIGVDDRNEYFIRKNDNIFFYDLTILSEKIIIEYNGIAFHPKFENIDTFTPIYKNTTSKKMYDKQVFKVNLAKSKGFKVLEIWSDDNDNFEKCMNFIKNNKKNGNE